MKLRLSILIFMILILLPINKYQNNVLNAIVWNMDGQVVENSAKVEFENCDRNFVYDLKSNINKLSLDNITIDIVDDYLDLDGKVYVDILTDNIDCNLSEKINEILTSINAKDNNIKTYYYTKGKIHNSDCIDKLNNILQIMGSKKINIVKSDKGYFGTAYTGYFRNNINAKDKIDMNFSINEYTSGTYVIIGTPIITCSY